MTEEEQLQVSEKLEEIQNYFDEDYNDSTSVETMQEWRKSLEVYIIL